MRTASVPKNEETTQCYKRICLEDVAMVLLGNYWYECNVTGGIIDNVLHFSGEVICPPLSAICPPEATYTDNWPAIQSVFPESGTCGEDIFLLGFFDTAYNYTVTLDSHFTHECPIVNVTETTVHDLVALPNEIRFAVSWSVTRSLVTTQWTLN